MTVGFYTWKQSWYSTRRSTSPFFFFFAYKALIFSLSICSIDTKRGLEIKLVKELFCIASQHFGVSCISRCFPCSELVHWLGTCSYRASGITHSLLFIVPTIMCSPAIHFIHFFFFPFPTTLPWFDREAFFICLIKTWLFASFRMCFFKIYWHVTQGFGKKTLLRDTILAKPVIFYIPFPSILFKIAVKMLTFKFDLPLGFFQLHLY